MYMITSTQSDKFWKFSLTGYMREADMKINNTIKFTTPCAKDLTIFQGTWVISPFHFYSRVLMCFPAPLSPKMGVLFLKGVRDLHY